MEATFNLSLGYVYFDEGGYTVDQGGPTNLGVTQNTLSEYLGRPATISEVQALVPATAAPVYHKLFWMAANCGLLPVGLDYFIFDAAVQHGAKEATIMLQRGLGMLPDGTFGLHTQTAVAALAAPAYNALESCVLARAAFYQSLGAWKSGQDTNGWTNRQLKVAARSVALLFGATPEPS